MFKTMFFSILIILTPLSLYAENPASQKLVIKGINTIYKVQNENGVIYVSSQPTLESLHTLKNLGVKTLINLRMPQEPEQLAKEHIQAENINYFNLPIQLNKVSINEIKHFHHIINNKNNYPILIHCSTGNRVTMMLAFNNIYFHHMTYQQAIDKANNEGLTSEVIRKFIKEFVASNPTLVISK